MHTYTRRARVRTFIYLSFLRCTHYKSHQYIDAISTLTRHPILPCLQKFSVQTTCAATKPAAVATRVFCLAVVVRGCSNLLLSTWLPATNITVRTAFLNRLLLGAGFMSERVGAGAALALISTGALPDAALTTGGGFCAAAEASRFSSLAATAASSTACISLAALAAASFAALSAASFAAFDEAAVAADCASVAAAAALSAATFAASGTPEKSGTARVAAAGVLMPAFLALTARTAARTSGVM
mmetsp:Transcript_29709/g.64872  ORF Transcript_29709/g.64872 Transcript_29709/m.64872 type:complete len:243 (-) Transcript_29709:1111-1839(-)